MPHSENQIRQFAEGLYSEMIDNLSNVSSTFPLIISDDATFPEFPGLTSGNLRNILLGGQSSGTASIKEFIQARAEYDFPMRSLSLSLYHHKDPFWFDCDKQSINQQHIYKSPANIFNEKELISHLVQSTYTITTRIWTEVQKKIHSKIGPK
jgi:hypothetical protein